MKGALKIIRYQHLLAIVLSAALLCFWAIYNGYPLFFNSDTAMYLEAAFIGRVRPDRPILYGLFMYYTSLQYTLWAVVVVQALLTALMTFYYFWYFSRAQHYIPYYVGFIMIVTFCMGASFHVSWLLADIFTAISILSLGLLLFIEQLRTRDLIIISAIAVLSIAMHNTHFFICLGLSVLLLGGFIFKGTRQHVTGAGLKLKRVVGVVVLILASQFFLSSVHYLYGGGFRGARGGSVFVMGSFVEMGVIDTYLAENCERKQYNLCQYRDSIPGNFLWADNSPIYKAGGWEACEQEYAAIVKDILVSPRYLKTVLYKSLLLSLKQFSHFDTGEAGKPTPRVEQAVLNLYPDEYERFSQAKQSKGELNFDLVNYMQTLVVAACAFVFILIFYFNKMTTRYRLFILFFLTALFINACLCGSLSGVYPRYQARLVWLLPLPLFLYVMERTEISGTDGIRSVYKMISRWKSRF